MIVMDLITVLSYTFSCIGIGIRIGYLLYDLDHKDEQK